MQKIDKRVGSSKGVEGINPSLAKIGLIHCWHSEKVQTPNVKVNIWRCGC